MWPSDFFPASWIRIRIRNLYADPDPAAQINGDPCGSGYGSGSETLLFRITTLQRDENYMVFSLGGGTVGEM
jgi:hypothetical protein